MFQRVRIPAAAAALILCMAVGPVLADDAKPRGAGGGVAKTVATVNGTVIDEPRLDQEMAAVQRQMARQGKAVPPAVLTEMRGRVLDSLIDQELLYQKGREAGIRVDDGEIAAQVDRMRQQFDTPAAFEEALAASGTSVAALTERMQHQAIIGRFIEERILPEIEIPADAADAFYRSHPDLFTRPEQVRARHILVRVGEEADDAARTEARARLAGIREKAVAGADFAELAQAHSEDPGSQPKGGDLGFFGRGRMVKPFEEAAFALAVDEISPVVETGFGYHLIQVTDRRPAGTVAFDEVRPRIDEHLKQQRVRERIEQTVQTLREDAKIEKFI